MTDEAAKKMKFVFIMSYGIEELYKRYVPCEMWTLETLRKTKFHNADEPIWFEKSINRELSVIYEDLSILGDEKIKKAKERKNHE